MSIKKIENLNIHENPSTNTNAFDVENYLNANWDEIKEVVNNNAEELEQAQKDIGNNTKSIEEINQKDKNQDGLIEELQTENTKLKKTIESMQIPGEATGNPIHLSDSSDMECEIVPKGNAEQETREGYNKLIYPYENTTKTTNGITFTDNGDGTITANGTATSKAYFNLSRPTLKPGSYTVSIEPADSANVSPFKYFFKFGSVNVTSSYKFEFTESFTPTESYLCINDGVTVNNLTFKPMLVEGNNVLPYQPYGASPSPNYPSNVETVGSNVNLSETNEIEIEQYSSNPINVTGYIEISKLPVTIQFEQNNSENYLGWIRYYDENKALLNQVQKSNSLDIGKGFTITESYDNAKYVAYTIRGTENTNTFPLKISKIKTEQGENKTPYSPYNQGSVEIEVCNKNLAKINETNWELTENNTIKNKAQNNGADLATIKIKKGSTAKICLKLFSKPTAATTFICWLDSEVQASKSFINFNGYNLNKIYINSITAEKDIEIRYQNSGNANSEIFEFQFWAEIDEATDYISHESYTKVLPIQKEFVKIGDYEDTFVKQDGKWYEKHCISKEKFNGAENWENQWSGDRFAWRLTLDNIKTTGSADDKGFVISNYFKLYTQNELYQKSEHYGICNRTNQEQIIIKNDDTTSTADFKAYFAEKYANGTPVIVYYVLETPELIPCTAGQEEILNSFYTYKNVTNISVDGIGTLKVNYKKDLETLFNNINSALLS